MAEPTFDVSRAHRWFAVEFNNAAWELVEKADRSPEETQRMIHLAHAAALHWSAIGQRINIQRAECLLATVYAAAGRFEPAALHAEYGLAISENGVDDETPFDRASLFAVAASIYGRSSGDADGPKFAALAKAEFTKLTEPDDRAVITKLYGVSP
jgi:hypothetical protein